MIIFEITIPVSRSKHDVTKLKSGKFIGHYVKSKIHEIFSETEIKSCGGIYIMYNGMMEIIYIGQAKNFESRMYNHNKFKEIGLATEVYKVKFFGAEGTELKNKKILDDLEHILITKAQPRYNIVARNNDNVKKYVDEYATKILFEGQKPFDSYKAVHWDGIDNLNKSYTYYQSRLGIMDYLDHCDCSTLSGDEERYPQWWGWGIPSIPNLVYYHRNRKMSLEYLSRIYGLPVEHLKMKIYGIEHQKRLNQYYGQGVIRIR